MLPGGQRCNPAYAHALQAINANLRGPALRQAEELLAGMVDTPLAQRLCASIEAARADVRALGMAMLSWWGC
jgi:hypothetical protein